MFAKNSKELRKLPVFGHKIKTKPLIQNLGHCSLDMDLFYKCLVNSSMISKEISMFKYKS